MSAKGTATNEAEIAYGSQTSDSSLEPISPPEAVERYLNFRRTENVSERTLRSHKSRLSFLLEWCEGCGIQNMNTLNGRLLSEFRSWRVEDGNLGKVSLRTQMSTLRVFIHHCEAIEAVEEGLSEKVLVPTLERNEDVRDEMLEEGRAEEILSYLRQFEYASRDHVLFELLWHTGMRIGGARSLDVGDFHPRNESLDLTHRPNSETPLKNGKESERPISLEENVVDAIEDYIEHTRPNVEDDYGREPLLASRYGRCGTSTLRRAIYRVTQPCVTGECPYDREPSECEEAGYDGGKCPSSVNPHVIRKGVVTHDLAEDKPSEMVSDRCDMSQDTMDKHYDKRTPEEKMEQRRSHFT